MWRGAGLPAPHTSTAGSLPALAPSMGPGTSDLLTLDSLPRNGGPVACCSGPWQPGHHREEQGAQAPLQAATFLTSLGHRCPSTKGSRLWGPAGLHVGHRPSLQVKDPAHQHQPGFSITEHHVTSSSVLRSHNAQASPQPQGMFWAHVQLGTRSAQSLLLCSLGRTLAMWLQGTSGRGIVQSLD